MELEWERFVLMSGLRELVSRLFFLPNFHNLPKVELRTTELKNTAFALSFQPYYQIQPPNGLRYPRVGGVGKGLRCRKKPEARKMLLNRADSHTSGARFVGLRFATGYYLL